MTVEERAAYTPAELREAIRAAQQKAWVEGTRARRDYRGDLVELNPYGRGGAR